MSAPLLELRSLRKCFGERRLLDIDRLAIEQGGAYVLVGANGCGKTTLMRIIAGLEPAQRGSMRFGAEEFGVAQYPEPLRHRIVYVHQHPYLFRTSLRHNLEYGLKCRALAPAERARRVEEALEWAGLRDRAATPPARLSGGEKQRAALARARALAPELLLLDEPTSNLDREGRAQDARVARPAARRAAHRDRRLPRPGSDQPRRLRAAAPGGRRDRAAIRLECALRPRGQRMRMKVFGFAGYSGSGKTTLIEQLIPRFVGRGVRVSLIKHAHHTFDVDQPGKDSYRHRHAGAGEVLVTSSRRWVLMHELRGEPEPSFEEQMKHLSPCDLVLIEGFKFAPIPKLEVWRAVTGEPLLHPNDPHIVAVASDAKVDTKLPLLDLNDGERIANFILTEVRLA